MGEAANIIAARAEISDHIQMVSEAPENTTVRQGGAIVVKLPYRFMEINDERDWFTLKLRAGFNGDMEEAVLEHKDKYGIVDDKRGFLRVELIAPAGGGELSFEAIATYGTGAWGTHEVNITDEARVDGAVQVKIL